ncbi:MAG: hypothetical protein EZS28_033154 [Streblomastix strix]|uniref:DH domain-containing protein n=1 Tax=Streblomastix strix TaxID=222440 RepID=A0A5J4ULC5_9EUKA|nr:MAG: hypothetical protein EZS28_033154 [Streblomastix strix]
MGLSTDICDCVSIGDPRDQCSFNTTRCDDSDIDLSDVPISRCECQSHDDERAGKSLSGYNCPAYCNYNFYSEGCACDSSKDNYDQCIIDQIYANLLDCDSSYDSSVQANTCKCKGLMSPSGCMCPRESSNLIDIPIDRCQCVDNDVRAGISCAITSECTDDQINPKCLCTYNHQGSGCTCTQSIHPQECECDLLGKSPFTISECQKTKICTYDDIPEGCTCAAIAERSVSGCESNTTLCKELSLESLKAQNESTCSCYQYGDPRNGSGEACFEQTNSCESGSSQQLQNIPIQLCECLAIGDVRSEQCSDSIPCKSASKEELMELSTDICDCVSIGDPRNECSQSKSCDDPSADLSNIPISLCQCIDVDDPRDDNLCKFQLKGVKLIVNTSNVNPLRFTFYGERFKQGQISIQIVEIQDKTEEEIKYEKDQNKQFEEKYNTRKSNQTATRNYNLNHKSNKNIQNKIQESLTTKFLNTLDQNLPNIISNQEELQRNEDGNIIWPPENATKLPLFIDDIQIESYQIATFSMDDITWLDSRKKWYGILISSDNETFVGKDGNVDEAVRIDVVVEEGEQFVNFNKNQTVEPIPEPPGIVISEPDKPEPDPLPFWLKLLIIIPVSTIALIFIFCFVIYICKNKSKQKQKRKEIERISHQTIELQRLKFQELLKEQELKEQQELESQRASRRQSIQSISSFRALNRRQQKKIENKAALTILRALLWNRDYHASRPAFELMRQQRNVVQELIESEKNYVSKMEDCIKYYLQPLQKLSKDWKIQVSQSQLKDIFINIEQILKFHQILFHELQIVAKNWTVHSRVGQMFCKQAPFMKVSVEYFQKKEKASKLLKELLKSDPKFKQIVDDISQQDEV